MIPIDVRNLIAEHCVGMGHLAAHVLLRQPLSLNIDRSGGLSSIISALFLAKASRITTHQLLL
jgi:hypothetical protein